MLNKTKRLFTSLLPVDPARTGACNRCGACCKLPYPCPFLRFDHQGLSSCAVYAIRPPSCRKYPRVTAEQLTPQECGYSFAAVALQPGFAHETGHRT
jgi:Fe-S-cluster containining protein